MNEPEIAVSFQDLEGSRVAFRRGCTAVPLQEGVTMFEYTVDWAINVSLNVQTVLFFFARLLSLSLARLSFPAQSFSHSGTVVARGPHTRPPGTL